MQTTEKVTMDHLLLGLLPQRAQLEYNPILAIVSPLEWEFWEFDVRRIKGKSSKILQLQCHYSVASVLQSLVNTIITCIDIILKLSVISRTDCTIIRTRLEMISFREVTLTTGGEGLKNWAKFTPGIL